MFRNPLNKNCRCQLYNLTTEKAQSLQVRYIVAENQGLARKPPSRAWSDVGMWVLSAVQRGVPGPQKEKATKLYST